MEVIFDGDDYGVFCDWCNLDFSYSSMFGGGIIHGEAVCPYCWHMAYKHAREQGKACPRTMTFKEFILKNQKKVQRVEN
jgi:hypothetical protein